MSDTSRSPFRRFPWVQLTFCVACLAMTAWTWMRYSYCWQTALTDFHKEKREACSSRMLDGMYVCLQCLPYRCTFADGTDEWTNMSFKAPWGEAWIGVVVPHEKFMTYTEGTTFTGRLRLQKHYIRVDTNASRFTGASVAGLVVGAMGCFIFGLYLRRWLRDRNTAFTTEGPPGESGSSDEPGNLISAVDVKG